MTREIEVDGDRWSVTALPREAPRVEDDGWHYARVRFESLDVAAFRPRETWLRLEEDIPAADVLEQYGDEELVEAFLVAEEVPGGDGGPVAGEGGEGKGEKRADGEAPGA